MKGWIGALVGSVLLLTVAAGADSPQGTLGNLQVACSREASARATYEGYARQADAEGYLGVAALFRASSIAEGVHAESHAAVIRRMGAVPKATGTAASPRSTLENLAEALKGEAFERETLYPAFIKAARAEGNKEALQSFTFAKTAEREHAHLFSEALRDPAAARRSQVFLVCSRCGYTLPRMPLEKCSFCSSPRTRLIEVR